MSPSDIKHTFQKQGFKSEHPKTKSRMAKELVIVLVAVLTVVSLIATLVEAGKYDNDCSHISIPFRNGPKKDAAEDACVNCCGANAVSDWMWGRGFITGKCICTHSRCIPPL